MATQTYTEWRTELRRRIWVSPGEPRNLITTHNAIFASGMTEISQWCKRLQIHNTSVWPGCSSYVDRAMTIVDQPTGVVRRVYTIANANWQDRVYYRPSRFKGLEHAARSLITDWVAPENTGLATLQQGIKFAEETTDSDLGRSRVGIWATNRNRFYLFPWLQSNESAVVEWDGHKTAWLDEDVLDLEYWTSQHRDCLEAYVRWRKEALFGIDRQLKVDLKSEYDGLLANLMCLEKAQTDEPDDDEPLPVYSPLQSELDDDAVPAAVGDDYSFAFVSDFGYPLAAKAGLVATLVKAWVPRFIVTGGDNMQVGSLGTVSTYALAVGAFYADYIGSSLADNRFWPALGNHDYDLPTNGLADYLAYFPFLPGNQRYYDFIKGPVHFFVVNAEADDPDGNTATSTQAKWLQVKLKLSTAKWKIVVLHRPPYSATGGNYPGWTDLRWPFKDWGANLVLSGHAHVYERFTVDELPYIVAGTGGGDLHAQAGSYPLVSAYLQASDYTHWGALYVTASCTALDVKFVHTDGTVGDTLTLTKPGVVAPNVPVPAVPTATGLTSVVNSLEVRELVLVLPNGTRVKISAQAVEDAIQLAAEAI